MWEFVFWISIAGPYFISSVENENAPKHAFSCPCWELWQPVWGWWMHAVFYIELGRKNICFTTVIGLIICYPLTTIIVKKNCIHDITVDNLSINGPIIWIGINMIAVIWYFNTSICTCVEVVTYMVTRYIYEAFEIPWNKDWSALLCKMCFLYNTNPFKALLCNYFTFDLPFENAVSVVLKTTLIKLTLLVMRAVVLMFFRLDKWLLPKIQNKTIKSVQLLTNQP